MISRSVARDFDPKIAALIRCKVHRIVASRHDKEDLRQEATLHFLEQLSKHNPARGTLVTFADRIVSNKLGCIARHRQRLKRDPSRVIPIDTVDEDLLCAPLEQIDLKLDVAAALSGKFIPFASAVAEGGFAGAMADLKLSRQQVRTMARKLGENLRNLRIQNQTARRGHIYKVGRRVSPPFDVQSCQAAPGHTVKGSAGIETSFLETLR